MKAANLLLFSLLGVMFAGCTQPGGSSLDSGCNEVYVVGCDSNPDAFYMLEEYSLHQFTNASIRISVPQIAGGLASWVQGGFGDPVWYHSFGIETQNHAVYPNPENKSSHLQFPGGGVVFFGQTPLNDEPDRHFDSTLSLWDPTTGEVTGISLPSHRGFFIPEGFDGTWGLVRDLREPGGENELQDDWWAVNVKTNEWVQLFDGGPTDGSYYGTPLVERVISGGRAFLSMRHEGPDKRVAYTQLIEVDLDTGERMEIANLTGQTVLSMDASPSYLTYIGGSADGDVVWVYDRAEREWFTVQRPAPNLDAALARAGGEWVVYLELYPDGDDFHNALVGIHVPTRQAFTLIEGTQDFGYVEWDTDGEYVVTKLQVKSAIRSNLQFEGRQLYWMELPDVE